MQELGWFQPHRGTARSSWSLLPHLDATFTSRWRGKSYLEGLGSNPCSRATYSLSGTEVQDLWHWGSAPGPQHPAQAALGSLCTFLSQRRADQQGFLPGTATRAWYPLLPRFPFPLPAAGALNAATNEAVGLVEYLTCPGSVAAPCQGVGGPL